MAAVGLSRREYGKFVRRAPDEYPKTTQGAATELRSRGYDVREHDLGYLIRTGEVVPGRIARKYRWTRDEIDRAALHFEEQSRYVPIAAGCSALGLSYGEYMAALDDAVGFYNQLYGEGSVPFDPDFFVMTVHPPRWDKDAALRFELCNDIRAQLEAKRKEVLA